MISFGKSSPLESADDHRPTGRSNTALPAGFVLDALNFVEA